VSPVTNDEPRARTQVVFRAANEAIFGPSRPPGPLTFLCECGDETCRAHVELTEEEYEAVRADASLFTVAPGHEPVGDAVVARSQRFSVVEKTGRGRAVAERADPRRNAGR
jgi:hypothetical protein